MYAVRFHGRGGQGAKTASRILGTAAFLSGYQAQDSPIYGAERRGAPVAAFTRFGREPIRERGVIAHPDLVVVADASLLKDPAARVSDGITDQTILFVNSPLHAEQIRTQSGLPGRITTLGVTEIALQHFGQREAISALLGAVAARSRFVIARLFPRLRHVDRFKMHDGRDGVEEGERILAGLCEDRLGEIV